MSGSQIRAGQAYIEFFGDTKKLDRALKNMGGRMKAFGKTIGTLGASMTGLGVAVGAAFIPAIKAASDFEEIMNKHQVVFGESSAAMKAWSDSFAAAVGRSEKEMANFVADSAALFKPLGFATAEAAELSKQVTTLGVDLASFKNLADADVIRDLLAALTGSGEVMKKYDVVLTEAAMKQELLNQGLDPKIATNAQKAQARLNIIMRGTTDAQGDATRSAGSWANQMKRLKAQLDNTLVTIGSALLPILTPLLTRMGDIATKAGAWMKENQGLVRVIALGAAGLVAFGSALMAVGGFLAVAGTALSGLVAGVGALLSPVGLVVAAIAALSAALAGGAYYWFQYTESGQAAATHLVSVFKWLTENIGSLMGNIWDAIAEGDLKTAFKLAFAGVVAVVGKLMGDVVNQLIDHMVTFARFLTGWAQTLAPMMGKTLTNGLQKIEAFAFGTKLAYGIATAAAEQYAFTRAKAGPVETTKGPGSLAPPAIAADPPAAQPARQAAAAAGLASAAEQQGLVAGSRGGAFSAAAASILGGGLRGGGALKSIEKNTKETAQAVKSLQLQGIPVT